MSFRCITCIVIFLHGSAECPTVAMTRSASLISPWLLWWPPAELYYNIYDHSAAGYVIHAHCIVLLYSVGNKITTATSTHLWVNFSWVCSSFFVTTISALFHHGNYDYRKTFNIRRTFVGNKIVDHSDAVGAAPVGAAPITSSFSTLYLASMDWAKATARRDEKRV